MKISQAKVEGLTHTFQCTVSASEFQERLDKFLTEKGADLKIQGFRPGKVPLSMLKQRFGASAQHELKEALVEEGVTTILKDNTLNFIGRPHAHVDSFKEGGELAFTVEFEQYPKIEDVDVSSLKIERLKPTVDKKEIDQTLERLVGDHKHSHAGGNDCPSEINDDFAKHIGFASLEELKKAIESHLEAEGVEMSFALAKRSVLDQLAKKAAFPLPKRIVEQEYQILVKEMKTDEDEAKPAKKDKTAKDSDDDLMGLAERRVRLAIMLADIGKKDKLELSQTEIQSVLFREFQKYPGQEKQVLAYYQKNPSAFESLKAPAYENKVIQAILAKAKVTEKTASMDELRKELEDIGNWQPGA